MGGHKDTEINEIFLISPRLRVLESSRHFFPRPSVFASFRHILLRLRVIQFHISPQVLVNYHPLC
jgi:hypothetical protein